MDLRVCEYCGMEYSADASVCPICGRPATPGAAVHPAETVVDTGARTAPKKGGKFAAKKGSGGKKAAPVQRPAEPGGNIYAIPKETEEQPQKTPEQRYTNEEDYHADPVEEEQKDLSVPCTGVSLDKTAITFQEAEQFSNVVVRTEPAGCTEEITFTSADESVATVNQQGKIVAVNGGSTEITATCGAYSAVCLVTCDFARAEDENEADAQLPALSSDDMTFTYPGEQATLLVSNVPEEAEILFSSADEGIATVSSSGVITAMSSGTTTVTVQTMGQTLECVVRCSLNGAGADGEETGCTLSNYDVTMGYKGEYFRLTLKDPEGKTITGLVWTSGDTSVCTVDEKGVVTYVAKGTTVVSTTYEGTTYECIVRCIVR